MFGWCARDFEHLVVAIELPPTIRCPVTGGILRIDVEQDEVAPIGVGVGESPGHVRVAANHERGRAGQRDADQTHRSRRLRPLERGAIPRVRHTYREVHVVGDERRAVRRQPSGDDPVVAPNRAVVLVRRTRAYSRAPRAESPKLRAQSRGNRRFRRRRLQSNPVSLFHAPRAKVVDIRAGDRWRAEGGAHDRRIPFGPIGREEIDHRLGHDIGHRRECGFVGSRIVLQRDEHRQDDEQAVFGQPWLGRLSKQQVLEGWFAEPVEADVDAGGVGVEHGARFWLHRRYRALCLGAEAMRPDLAVDYERARADER